MQYLGIDFGSKKVGVARSDTAGLIAFPHDVWPNDDSLIAKLTTLITELNIGAVVVGDTRTADGRKNDVSVLLDAFITALTSAVHVPVYQISEFGTTQVARALTTEGSVRGMVQSPQKDTRVFDAQAAALILQRFLDAQRGA